MIASLLAVILAWDPSVTPPAVNGYRLKSGTEPGVYNVVQYDGTDTWVELKGLAPATYYFAAFAYNAAGESVASNEVQYVQASPTPTPTPSGATIAANINSVAPGGAVRAIVSNGPGNRTDWIILAPVNSDVQSDPFNTWRYLHGKRVPPPVGMTNATLTFAAPSASGLYEFRLLEADSYNLLDSSEPISVGTAPTLTLTLTPTPTPTPVPTPTPASVRSVTVKTKHLPGSQVTISAPATIGGKSFQTWIGDTGILANPQDRQTTFTVPSSLDVQFEATYQP